MKTTNPRKRKLDSISTKIAMFLIGDTYQDEKKVRDLLEAAIQTLDQAAALCVNYDAQAAAEAEHPPRPNTHSAHEVASA